MTASVPLDESVTGGTATSAEARIGARVLDTFIDAASCDGAIERIVDWARARKSRAIYFCNVHSVVAAREDAELDAALAASDLAAADGQPIAWMLRRNSFPGLPRVTGTDLMRRLLARAESAGLSVYFYGERPSTLERLSQALQRDFPMLRVAGMHSPPFRALTQVEDQAIVEAINASGANIVFVSLGCPKQEKWIAARRGRIVAPMLGVGAAIAFYSGVTRRAPIWMQRYGLEWLHRLASEPRRLGWRYLATNSIFIALAVRGFALQLMRRLTARSASSSASRR